MYKDRIDAANQLAKTLVNKGLDPTKLVVLSIPRGGAVIGDILASKLNCQHQIIISKKLGAPNQPELAIGAITEDGEPSLNNGLIDSLNINNYYLDQEISQVRQ